MFFFFFPDSITITTYVCETHIYPAFSVRIALLIKLKSFCRCRGWIYRPRADGWTHRALYLLVAHHLIQRLKALQPQLSFPRDWFPSENDYFKIRFGYLRWVSISKMHSSSTTAVLGNHLGNPLVLKNDLCCKFLEQPNNQGFFLENDYFFPQI